MRKFLFILVAFFCAEKLYAQGGIPVPQMTQCDNLVNNFLTTYNIPGATFALSKDGKIVYLRSFGYSDIAKTIPVQPYNVFRIASVSKPITSIAIMKMMQDGLLTMNSKVFGAGGLLENHPVISTATITDNRIYNITVQQLLEHTAGWNRNVNCNPNPTTPYPYYFSGCDPINNPLTVTQALGLPNPVTEAAICKYMLQKGLNFAPGTAYNYSNVGYLYLGEIIKQISGMEYEDYVKNVILAPLGIFNMHIAKNLLSEKQEREVEYVGLGHTNLSVYGTGQQVVWEYGGMNVNAMDAHGGWITTASDLVKLITAVDGFTTKPDILTPASINVMTTPSTSFANYAKGWQVNTSNNWWHSGAIPGTATIIARTAGGYTWSVLLNKRNETNSNFWNAFDALPWNCIAATSTWPTHDLMLTPTQNASGITFSNVTNTSITVSWTNGNGGSRLLLVRPNAAINQFPKDGTEYTANANYTTATSLGGDVRVVYDGTGNSATITNLNPATNYYFRLVEYNKTTETGNNALYLLGNNPQSNKTTETALPVRLTSFAASKIAQDVHVKWSTSQEVNADKFIVERSIDGKDFSNIGSVAATGNNTNNNTYNFIDQLIGNLLSQLKLYYRLTILDKDGSKNVSPVAIVKQNQNFEFTISPNPAKNTLYVQGNNVQKVEILGVAGNRLINKDFVPTSNISVDISSLKAGVYWVRITNKDGEQQSRKVVVQ